jgi:hypothetical protein
VTFHTLMPGAFGKAGNPLTVRKLAGAWFIRQPATIDGVVVDERRGLGTARPVQPRRAMLFNGTNQYVVHTLPSPISAYPFTLFGWGKKSGTSTRAIVGIGWPTSGTKHATLMADDGDAVQVVRRNTTEVTSTQAIAALPNQWASYVAVFLSSTEVNIYRNGVLVANFTGLTAVNLDADFTTLFFGVRRLSAFDNYWDGYAQHCGYTRTAATLADAQAFHETGIMPNAERQLFPLDDNSTTVARDIITGAEATIVNGAAGNALHW